MMTAEAKSSSSEIIAKLKLREVGAIFGSIAAPLIILFSLNRFIQFSDAVFEVILTSTISVTFVLLLVFLVIREIMSARKEKYANITEKHHFCFHTARDIETFLNASDSTNLTEDEKKRIFTTAVTGGYVKILDSVATIYSMLTGTRCRATIKSIYENEGRLFVRTLARDTASYEHNWEWDINRFQKNQDAIEENEDFELLYSEQQPGQNYFFCNNLIERRIYNTSSFKVYGSPEREIGWLDRLRCKGWTLPYRSAIVWPIQQKASGYFAFEEIGCIGFLSVDSESRGVFHRKWDTWIGAGIADSLFHPINMMFNVLETQSEEKGNEKSR